MYLDNISLIEAATSVDENIAQPETWSLDQNYPNPFNPITTIRFANPQNAHILLSVYNVRGQRIQTLMDGFKSAGTWQIAVDGSDWPSGLYFYKLETPAFMQIRKMILMK